MDITPDVLVRYEGILFLFGPLTDRAKDWLEQNVEIEPWQWSGDTFVVEHRYTWGLGQGMKDAGLVIA
jgi:hypothetical protein